MLILNYIIYMYSLMCELFVRTMIYVKTMNTMIFLCATLCSLCLCTECINLVHPINLIKIVVRT